MQTETEKTDSGKSNEDSAKIEESRGEESRQKPESVEEILTEIINDNKITEDTHTEHDLEDTADPNEAAAEQSKVEEPQIPQADVSSDQENIAQDPDTADDSTDTGESNEEPAIVEGSDSKESEQEQPAVEEALTGPTDAGETADDAQAEQVPEETVDPGDAAGKEQNKVEESQLRETDISSEQNDDATDTNEANGVAETADAAPEKGEEITESEIFEAIQKITKSQGDLPGQSITEENSTPDITSGLLEKCASEIMQNNVTWASPDDSLQNAFAKMQQTDAGYIMIGLNEALEGIVSKSDLTKAMSPYLLPIFSKRWIGVRWAGMSSLPMDISTSWTQRRRITRPH